jgi:hypothetical protein
MAQPIGIASCLIIPGEEMDYERLKEEIKTIADIASGMAEAFREKCFELLLQHLLAGTTPTPAMRGEPVKWEPMANEQHADSSAQKPRLPAQVRVLLQRTGLTEQHLWSVVTVEDNEVHSRSRCHCHNMGRDTAQSAGAVSPSFCSR